MTTGSPPPLGIVAGAGALPRLVVRSCAQRTRACFVLALKGFADSDLLDRAPGAWISMGQAAAGFDLLHRAGVKELIMVGGVKRPSLSDLIPDWRTAAFLARVAIHALGDDGVLRAVIAEIEREGLRVVGVPDVAPDLLASAGIMTRGACPPVLMGDIQRGIAAALELGRADAGQAVVVSGGQVVAREDISGTDALIARAGRVNRLGGAVLVKCKKPSQDPRVDLPAIGPATVAACAKAGIAGIAVEAGATILIGRDETIAAADAAGIFIAGVEPGNEGSS